MLNNCFNSLILERPCLKTAILISDIVIKIEVSDTERIGAESIIT